MRVGTDARPPSAKNRHKERTSGTNRGDVTVAANKGGDTVYWAAVMTRAQAIEAVRDWIGPAWVAALTNQRLRPERLASLKLLPNEIRELGPTL